jgi:hypothetical protein
MKRKRTITIEIEHDLLVHKRQRTIQIRCSTCGSEMEIASPVEVPIVDGQQLLEQYIAAARSGCKLSLPGSLTDGA